MRAAATVSTLLLLLAVGGCGGSSRPTATQTQTVTVTSMAPDADAADPTLAATAAPSPTSEVGGRGHDVGTITATDSSGEIKVLRVDRWTYADWDDDRVAEKGVPVEPLTENPFRNQNSANTYRVPVSPAVVVGLNRCAQGGDGVDRVVTTSGSLDDLVPGETMWLFTYTDGELTQAQTAAVC